MMTLDDLVKALGCSDRAYRRDDCGDWCVMGKAGRIYAQPEGFFVYCDPGSKQAWTWVKKALDFCPVLQDGEDDGFLILRRLPTEEESEIVRDKLAIRKRKELSDAEKERLRLQGAGLSAKRARSGAGSANASGA